RAGAIGAVSGAHDLVVLPALPIAILPGSVLLCDHSEAVGKAIDVFSEKLKTIKELTHALSPLRLQPLLRQRSDSIWFYAFRNSKQHRQFVSASPRRWAEALSPAAGARHRRADRRDACNSPR